MVKTSWDLAGHVPAPYRGIGGIVVPSPYQVTVTGRPRLPYDLVIDVVVEDGELACERLELHRKPNGTAITMAKVRKIPLGRLLRNTVPILKASPSKQEPGVLEVEPVEEGQDLSEAYRPRPPRKQRGLIDSETLRQVAQTYQAAQAAGESGRPIQAVMSKLHVSRATAYRHLKLAKERGYLQPTPQAPSVD
jgi:hypothetical protein